MIGQTSLTFVLAQSSDFYLTQVMNGLVLGMVFILVALGLSIIFGMMGIINFAHGDMLLVGTYMAWWVTDVTGSLLLGLVVAPVTVFVLGLVVERTLLRSIYGRDPLLGLMLTFGLAEVLREAVQIIWGSTGKNFSTPNWASATVDFGLFTFPSYRLFVLVMTVVTLTAVYLFLTRTDIGMIIRAGSQDRELVSMLGVDISRIYLLVFAIGAGLAGWAGALIGPIRSANPELGITLLLPAFVVVIVGGVGRLRGTIVAGLIIGQIVVLTGILSGPMSNVVIYIFMAIVLLVRPEGLYGSATQGAS